MFDCTKEHPISIFAFAEQAAIHLKNIRMATDSREIWGPKVWKMLHLFADVSDRRDVALLWANVMKTTSEVLPCAICRKHLQGYLKTHTFMKIRQPNLIEGQQVRQQIMSELHLIHNVVNHRLGKPIFPFESLKTTYLGTRVDKLLEAKNILEELKLMWGTMIFRAVNPAALLEWKRSLNLLAALLT